MNVTQWTTAVEQFKHLALQDVATGEKSSEELQTILDEVPKAFAPEVDPLYAGVQAALTALTSIG